MLDGLLRPATSTDVARLAGVSRSTVSNILNGNDARFPEDTKRRVLEAARELEYQPSPAGRSLVSGRSDTVVVLVPNTSFGGNLQDAVDQVMVETQQIGGNVVVRFASDTGERTRTAINALRPLALVDFGGVLGQVDHEWLEARGTIVVPSWSDVGNGPMDGGLSSLQADVLLESGPRPLWFAALSDKRVDHYGPLRLGALQKYCATHGLEEPMQVDVPVSREGGIAALRRILGAGMPAAVACYNDDVALSLLAAARELSVAVPAEVSVMGVDFTPLGQIWSPPLTTIDTDSRGLVNVMAEELRARLKGSTLEGSARSRLRFSVVRGQTT